VSLEARLQLRIGSLDVDLELAATAGQVVAVLGPNGAGKTTFLRALAGLQPIAAGHISLDGQRLDDPGAGVFVAPDRRRVGFVFQDYLLFPHLSALDNVAFGPRRRGSADAAEIARDWLARVGLAELGDVRPGRLSGGQAQRVALARALATRPRLLLLDEPLAALDATSRVAVRRELKRHLAGFDGIALLVSHDPVDAAALADRVVVLEAGRVTQRGTLAEITAQPRSQYVADLAGVNLWRGEAAGGQVSVDGALIATSGDASGAVYVLLHPRAVSIYREQPHGSPRNVWRARVAAIDASPGSVRVRVLGPLPLVAEVTPAALAELGLAGGEQVWTSFKASEVDVYPA
jgi:molybdate transport system ATP-binding protein